MPRYQAPREFQLGDYWLSKQTRSKAWCRTWYDAKSRQTKRASLGTTDFEEAKQKLTDWFVLAQTKVQEAPEEALLAEVISRYWEGHGKVLASAERTRISLRYWLDFFGDIAVADLGDMARQEAFHDWLREKGMKGSSIGRVLTSGKAAINYAWKRGELASVPFIAPVKKEDQGASEPRGRPMEVEEVARLLEASDKLNFHLFVIFMLATAGRPDAIKDLTLERLDVDNRLIILNPPDRGQTTKYRPTLRMPEAIVPLVQELKALHSPELYLVGLKPTKTEAVRTAWRGARSRANLDAKVNPYSLRHTMARWLRKNGVPAWEVSAQLGHKRSDLSITEIYAPYDPTYLNESVRVIDIFFAELRVNCVLLDRILNGDFLDK